MVQFEASTMITTVLAAFISGIGAAVVISTFLRKPTPPPPVAAPLAIQVEPTLEPKKEDTSLNGGDDEKVKDNSPIIDDAYKRIHQRYNRKDYKWEDFDPIGDTQTHEGVIFIVYHRHYEPMAVRPLERLVEVQSESLKDVLKACVKHIDTVFDPKPMIDAQKLYNHEDQLKVELEKLQDQLKMAEENEKAAGVEKGSDDKDNTSSTVQVGDGKVEPANLSARLLNGNSSSSSSSDTTAVNTPASSPTPVPSSERETIFTADPTIQLSASTLKLQVLHLEKLLNYLDTEFAPTKQKLADLLANNDIKFNLLWCLYRLGDVITFKDRDSGLTMAGEITSAEYMRRGDAQEFFDISVRYIDYNGSSFYYAWQRMEISFFKDLRKIRLLAAQPLGKNTELLQSLKARGEAFTKLKGTHYLEYHDYMIQRRSFGLESRILKFRATGRAMVDCSSYQKMNPESYFPDCDEEDKIDEIPPSEYHFCAPTVFGYSFVTKMWGRLVADKFSPIIWNKAAFEHLVLPEGTKTLIKSLVDADRAGSELVKDVITGKGGGCIVILHGRPGTGKTLTAEAIAEERQKPLMVISVGELGKDASELEAKLVDILEISKLWEAVLLLDEADVFLEARSLHELHRNAMVGVFLRLLEYHQRVMFLTTNRVTTLDEAFKSRISIAIKYRDLDHVARRQVWENFLGLAGVKIVDGIYNGVEEGVATITKADVKKLAAKKLNGRYNPENRADYREIKNTTRTAQALAVSVGEPLGYDLLKQVLDVGEQFDKDFKEIDTSGMYDAKGESLKDHHALYH